MSFLRSCHSFQWARVIRSNGSLPCNSSPENKSSNVRLQDKVALLWRQQCPPTHLFCADFNMWSHAMEYIPDPDTLVSHIDNATALWVESHRECYAKS